ncbi:MAG TPA: hypothetical protein DCO72_00080 [Ruminococcus sp.]|nr:hypothetical protein [Ruminococcus sp.]
MEFIIGAVIIIVLLLILGVPPVMIGAGIVILLEFLTVLMALFFVVMLILLLISKPVKVKFLRIYIHEVVGTYAIYEMNGKEYKNTFPAEIMFVDKIYKKDKIYPARFRQGKKGYMLYDWYSYIVIGVGLPLSAVLAGGLGWFLLIMLGAL